MMKCSSRSLAISGIIIVLSMMAVGYLMSDDVFFGKATIAPPVPLSSGSSTNDESILNYKDDDQLIYA